MAKKKSEAVADTTKGVVKFSPRTLEILKNFGEINPNVYFRKGSSLTTVNPQGNNIATASIKEEIPVDAGIYDLSELLGVISLFGETPDVQFEDTQLVIAGLGGRSSITYRYCSPTVLNIPEEGEIEFPEVNFSVVLTPDDISWVLKTAKVLQSPHVYVESDGKKTYACASDLDDDASNVQKLEVEGKGQKCRFVFKTENLKLIPGGYVLDVSSEGIARFTALDDSNGSLVYYITLEEKSSYFNKE